MSPPGDLTVGEVLSLLQEDFPEATLGRLREFEDLTLIAPELGPSGHRRYPAETLERLRWVLAKMREGFDPADLVGETDEPLESSGTSDPRPSGSAAVVRKKSGGEPLAEPTLFDTSGAPDQDQAPSDQTAVQPLPKVAAGRSLASAPPAEQVGESDPPRSSARSKSAGQPTAAHRIVEPPADTQQRSPRLQPDPPAAQAEPEPAAAKPAARAATAPTRTAPQGTPSGSSSSSSKPANQPSAQPAPKAQQPAPAPASGPSESAAADEPKKSDAADRDLHAERKARIEAVSALQEPPRSDAAPRPRPSRTRDLPSATKPTELLTRTDFLGEVDIDDSTLGDMESFGVISPVTIGGTSSYDQSAVSIGHIVANLLKLGYEARHLRMFRMASEREVDLLRQMALPLLKQRNPVGREQARERLHQAADLGAQLRSALMAEGIAELIDHSGADAADG